MEERISYRFCEGLRARQAVGSMKRGSVLRVADRREKIKKQMMQTALFNCSITRLL